MTSPDEDHDKHLDSVLIGGREPASVIIADYDPAWPGRSADLQRRVQQALGATALSVEHIGSTSVPGLAAKPIIDMLLTVRSVDDEAAYVGALEKVGLVLRVREPGTGCFGHLSATCTSTSARQRTKPSRTTWTYATG